eukprot:gene24275-biopygen1346
MLVPCWYHVGTMIDHGGTMCAMRSVWKPPCSGIGLPCAIAVRTTNKNASTVSSGAATRPSGSRKGAVSSDIPPDTSFWIKWPCTGAPRAGLIVRNPGVRSASAAVFPRQMHEGSCPAPLHPLTIPGDSAVSSSGGAAD